MERLRQDEAVERAGRNVIAVGEIADDGRGRIAFIHVQDVALRHVSAAELMRVGRIADLDHVAVNLVGMLRQKTFDVVAVDRLAAVVAVPRG